MKERPIEIFIDVEGPLSSGKTTVVGIIKEAIERAGLAVAIESDLAEFEFPEPDIQRTLKQEFCIMALRDKKACVVIKDGHGRLRERYLDD